MASRGRPPIGPPVIVRIPPSLLAAIDRAASAAGVSRAEMIRQTIERGLR
jgi:metal-responsive CopG/Arc/MetJ family transcriptional regulator